MRHQDFRNPRRREFDADTFYPQPRTFGTRPRFNRAPMGPPSGPPVSGVVKWFNPEKGFGFVSPADGSPDVFLHVSALKQAGLQDAPEGSTIVCEVGPGRKGVQVLRVITLDTTTAVQRPPRRPSGPRQYDR